MGVSNTIQQLSVFLENKDTQLDEALRILSENGINIVALSLADTCDYGMLRLVVSNPHKGRIALREAGIASKLEDVIAFRLSHAVGSLGKAMHYLVDGEIRLEYMYCFANGNQASCVLKTNEIARAVDILNGTGFEVYSADEAYLANQ
ncbi:MAG: amino acid-binding protein [Dorea sp.]|nr:amino acid-binding protein [Dorea sp.]